MLTLDKFVRTQASTPIQYVQIQPALPSRPSQLRRPGRLISVVARPCNNRYRTPMNGITPKVLSEYCKQELQQLRGKRSQNCTGDWKSRVIAVEASRIRMFAPSPQADIVFGGGSRRPWAPKLGKSAPPHQATSSVSLELIDLRTSYPPGRLRSTAKDKPRGFPFGDP